MPNREFKCPGCKYIFEEIVDFGVESFLCPKCDERALRVFSMPSIIFKGQGWTQSSAIIDKHNSHIEDISLNTNSNIPFKKDGDTVVIGKENK